MTTIGEKIYQLRRTKGYSQTELAELSNVTLNSVSAWETSQKKPNSDKLLALANALETSASYLVGEIDDSRPLPVIMTELAKLAAKVDTTTTTNVKTSVMQKNIIAGDNSANVTLATPAISMSAVEPEVVSQEPESRIPWWIDVMTKAYEMENTRDVRAMEALRALQLAEDVLKRVALQVTTA